MSFEVQVLYALCLIEGMCFERDKDGRVVIVMAPENDVWLEDGMLVGNRLVGPLAAFIERWVV